jgi:HlyD family secretion protein/epimerase transport system membrane fusion protein
MALRMPLPATGPEARPRHVPAAPTRAIGFVAVGFVTIIGAFGGFGVWASLAPLDSAVVAPASLVVESNRRQIQHAEGGIVREILVSDGTTVRQGDVLIRLDGTRPQATLAIVRAQMDAALVLQARLRAESAQAAEVVFPAEVVARRDQPAVRDLVNGQLNIFAARRAAIDGQLSILRQRVAQLEQQQGGLRVQGSARDRQISLINEELRGTRELADKGHAPKTRVLALEREVARLEGERGEHTSAISRINEAIGEARLQMLQIQRAFHEDITTALQDVHTKLLEYEGQRSASQDVVDRLEIRAPSDGVIVGLAVHTIGSIIPPGRTVMEIVPDSDRLTIEAQISIQEITHVIAGQSAMVHFVGLHQRTLPTLTGTVLQVSADRLTDERTGAPYFKARIEPDAESLAKIADQRLVPGMSADVVINTGERTALRYFLDPFIDLSRYAMRER